MSEINNNSFEFEKLNNKEKLLFESEIVKTGKLETYPNAHIKGIKENVYAVFKDKGDLAYYGDENGKVLFNVSGLRKIQFIDTGEAIVGSGYFEIKEGNNYKLHRIVSFDKDDKPILEKVEISPYSEEYYKAWTEINFNSVMLGKTLFKKNDIKLFTKEELEKEEKNISIDIKTGAITIDDLEIFYSQKKISKDFFEKSVKKVVEEKLLLQCSDSRFDINEEKLKTYYEKGYINSGIAKNCFTAIKNKEEKKLQEKKINMDAKIYK